MYQKSIKKFIDGGGISVAFIQRWIKNINVLNQKKSTNKDVWLCNASYILRVSFEYLPGGVPHIFLKIFEK